MILVNLAVDADGRHDIVTAVVIPLFVAAGCIAILSPGVQPEQHAMLLWVDAPYLAVTSFLAAMFVWRPFATGGVPGDVGRLRHQSIFLFTVQDRAALFASWVTNTGR